MREKPVKHPESWREIRRLRAWELKRKGWKQKDIAEALGVSEGAVSRWISCAEERGEEALYARRGDEPPLACPRPLLPLPHACKQRCWGEGGRGVYFLIGRISSHH